MPNLNPDGLPVVVDGVEIVSPGLTGVVHVHPGGTAGTRGAEFATNNLVASMAATGMRESRTIEISEHQEIFGSGGTRAAGGGADIEITVPGPGPGFGQVLLYAAEDGSLSWHAPQGSPALVAARGQPELTYRVPRAVVPAEDVGQRGLVGVIAKKLLKVLTFDLIAAAAGAGANWFVARFEKEHRPHRLRTFEPQTYGEVGRELGPDDWTALAGGRALLFIHGTASSTRNAFGRIPQDLIGHLHTTYGGRVFAFDHPSVSAPPDANLRWLANHLPPGVTLELDVVAHSRGGLVGRLLTERAADFGLETRVRVARLLMIATPNAGTRLAHPDHLNSLVDRFTNLLQFVPSNGVTDALDVVLSTVQQVAVGALEGLDGLMSMNPEGKFLTQYLNTSGAITSADYIVIAANYEPPRGSPLLRSARDHLTDIVFGRDGNDLVVPTAGVYEAPGASMFPIASPVLFGVKDYVDHSSYWDKDPFIEAARKWLTG